MVEDLCDYVNEKWDGPAIYLAAYAMWRLNWIDPFADGKWAHIQNPVLLRALTKLGVVLPGTPTLPELVIQHRAGDQDALDQADAACNEGSVDVSAMERLIELLLAKQLARVYEMAAGRGGIVGGGS